MKKTYKFLLATVFLTGALFQSCETTELEQVNSPNNLTSGDPEFLLNNIQTSYRAQQRLFNDESSDLTRIDYFGQRNYFAGNGSGTMNGPWQSLYSTLLPDLQGIEAAQTDANDLRFHVAIAKMLQGHLMMQLVDWIGDIVPLDQATNPIEFPTPELTNDGGATAYAQAIAVIDEAIALLNQDPSTTGLTDLFYGGDASKWIKLGNTLKMRAALTTGDISRFNGLVSAGNYISDSSDDFQFNYGTLLAPVNTQHPDYQNDYTSSGANIYQSNWLMNNMLQRDDPRMRYYFYRQSDCTPGASCQPEGNGETLSCSLEATPTHLQGTPSGDTWCFMEDGYWGRQHGDDDGTPPDNFTRTAVGVYPATGRFDDDRFSGVALGQSGNGAGIEPIILASYVDFWIAEVALEGGGSASAALTDGMTKSIAKVQSFISFDADADTSFEPSSADVDNYIADTVAAFDAASGDDKWNILAEQYWIALYGGGADAHNFYRRTGYPTTVADNIDPNPGNYPRTLLFPGNEVSANPNVLQRTDNDDAVFWNTQALPPAN